MVAASSPVLTRLYTPAQFGVLAVFISILSSVVVTASLRYELAIPLADNDDDAWHILVLSLAAVAVTSATVAAVVILWGPNLARLANTPALVRYLWLLPIGFLGIGVYQVLSYWMIRREDFKVIARTRINQGVAQVGTQLGMGMGVQGPAGLLVGYVVGQAGGSGTMIHRAHPMLRDRAVEWSRLKSLAFKYMKFPVLGTGSALLNSMGLAVPLLVIAVFYGPAVAGLVALGQRVLAIPVTLIGRAVAQVYFGEASRASQLGSHALRSLLVQTVRKLTLIGGLPIILFALMCPPVFAMLFGSGWREAGVFVQLQAFAFAAQFVVFPVSQTLNIVEKQDWQLYWDAGRFVLVVGSLVVAGTMDMTVTVAIAAYSAFSMISYLVLLVCSLAATRPERLR